MQHLTTLDGVQLKSSWLTIGSYDGVHLGHQEIINHLVRGARRSDAPSVVLTFFPNPGEVIRGKNNPIYLTNPSAKAQLLGELGIDLIITYPFTKETANFPGKFFLSLLKQKLDFRELWIGPDFAMGNERDTGITELTEYQSTFNYHLHISKEVQHQNQRISSSWIRSLLSEGNVEQAANLLGRLYSLTGTVIHGDGRGRQIGVPTANLKLWQYQLLPANGVYACAARRQSGEVTPAAVNIGIRPTFDGNQKITVEAHLLDFSEDLYGAELQLDFIRRIRGEMKFPDINSLVAQIQKDIQETRLAAGG